MIRFPDIGRHDGDVLLMDDMQFRGLVTGTVTVPPGRKLHFHGRILGDLIVQADAHATIHGSVGGVVRNQGAAVTILGRVGSVQDSGSATTYINDRAAMTAGAAIPEAGRNGPSTNCGEESVGAKPGQRLSDLAPTPRPLGRAVKGKRRGKRS